VAVALAGQVLVVVGLGEVVVDRVVVRMVGRVAVAVMEFRLT
jgi:hypothetical protein